MGGSKSAKGGPNPLADMDRGGPYPLADLDRGVQIRGGSKSAVTPVTASMVSANHWLIAPTRRLGLTMLQATRAWGSFLDRPEAFRAHFGLHNSLCIFKAKASRGTKLCIYFNFYSLYNI